MKNLAFLFAVLAFAGNVSAADHSFKLVREGKPVVSTYGPVSAGPCSVKMIQMDNIVMFSISIQKPGVSEGETITFYLTHLIKYFTNYSYDDGEYVTRTETKTRQFWISSLSKGGEIGEVNPIKECPLFQHAYLPEEIRALGAPDPASK